MVPDLGGHVRDLLSTWPARHLGLIVVGPEGVLGHAGDLDRRFPLASVTKPLVASAVMLAVEEGALALDDAAGPPGSTVRHLLAHASGLTPDGREVMAAPGARRIYSNSGFEMLAESFEASVGFSLADYLDEGVCRPLAMTSTRLMGSAAHSAVSTVDDLARWVVAIMHAASGRDRSGTKPAPPIWHHDTIRDLSTVQFGDIAGVLPGFGPQTPNPWGLGFEIRGRKTPHWTGQSNSPATFGHFGRSGTFVWIDPEVSLGVVALGDADFDRWAVDLWPRLSDAILADHSGF